jgi:hypothetical protein
MKKSILGWFFQKYMKKKFGADYEQLLRAFIYDLKGKKF